MKNAYLFTALAALGLTVLLASDGTQAQTPPPLPVPAVQPDEQPPLPDNGIEPLARGPVHEAFAQPDTANPQPSPIVPTRPPDGIDEVPPAERPEGANVVWIPGYWAWEEDAGQYVWVSGLWRDVPPDRQWMPGYWIAVEGGYQWVHGYWTPVSMQEVMYQPPPPPSLEVGPSVAAPQENMIYIPGIWIYRQTRYVWRPGFWVPAYADWIYVPASYIWTPAGCVFVDGYWDYPLMRRGVLFCPVQIAPTMLAQPNFYYQPAYAVSTPALFTALFVQRDFDRFQFGNYFGPHYRRLGVVPWFQYQVARGVMSPLFEHYRWHYRGDRAWAQNLQRLYTERERGLAPLPPTTVVQQNRMIQNITLNKTVVINNKTVRVNNPQSLVQNLQIVAPLKQAAKISGVRLQAVPRAALAQEQRVATQIRQSAAKRRDVEMRLIAEGHRPTRPTDPARTAKLTLAPRPGPAAKGARVQAPVAPKTPAHVERPLPKHVPLAPKRITPRPTAKTPPGGNPAVRPEYRPANPTQRPKVEPRPNPIPVKPAPRPEVKPMPPAPHPAPKVTPPAPKHPQPAPAVHPQPTHPAPAAHPMPAANHLVPKGTVPVPKQPQPVPAVHPQPTHPAPAAHPVPTAHPAPVVHPQPAHPAPAAHPVPAAHPAPKVTPPAPVPQVRPQPHPVVQPPHQTPAPHPAPPAAHPVTHSAPPAVRPQPQPQPRPAPQPHPRPQSHSTHP